MQGIRLFSGDLAPVPLACIDWGDLLHEWQGTAAVGKMSISLRHDLWYNRRTLVRGRTGRPDSGGGRDRGGMAASKEGAERLKARLTVAMAEAKVGSWTRLALKSGVSEGTIQNIIYGVTEPRYRTLAQIAGALTPYVTVGELEREYQGLAPEEPPLVETLRQLVPELSELVTLLRAQADQEVLEAVRDVLDRRRRGLPPRDAGDRHGPSDE